MPFELLFGDLSVCRIGRNQDSKIHRHRQNACLLLVIKPMLLTNTRTNLKKMLGQDAKPKDIRTNMGANHREV